MYQLQTELQKAQIQSEFQRRHSLRCGPPAEARLEEEVRSLRCQLDKVEKLDPVRTLTAADGRSELLLSSGLDVRLVFPPGPSGHFGSGPGGGHGQPGGAGRAAPMLQGGQRKAAPRQTSGACASPGPSHLLVRPPRASCPLWLQLLDQTESLSVEVQQLTQDCNLQQQKNAVAQAQMRELLSEREQVTLPPSEPASSGSSNPAVEKPAWRLSAWWRRAQLDPLLHRLTGDASAPGPSRLTCPETKPRP